jgi:ABC-2 type transport system permease protein
MLASWLVAAAMFGFVLGSVAHNVSGFFDSPQMKQYLVLLGGEKGLTDAFLAAEVGIFGVIAAAYGIAAVLRLRSEETGGHAEVLLATPATRLRWAVAHIVTALGGTAAILLLTGASIGLAHGLAMGDPWDQTVRLAGAAAAQIPAAWVMVGLAALLFGWVPLLTTAAWVVYVCFIVVGEFGGLWQLPQWVLDVSPFAHSPRLPGADVGPVSLIGLLAVTVVLLSAAAIGWRRRDLKP